MRILLSTLLIFTSLFGIGEDTNTMKANFTQTITDDKNSTLTYSGTMLAKRPYMAMWHYLQPIEKSIYIDANEVTIVEPELEQAIIKRLDNTIDILAILSSATKQPNGSFIALYHDKEYTIVMNKRSIKQISYMDAFDNLVIITFKDQKINSSIDDSQFTANIPLDFDVIKD